VLRLNKIREVLRITGMAFYAVVLASTLSACSEGIDELLDTDVLPDVEIPDPIPPATPPAEEDITLETLHEVFVGQYGCQNGFERSLVNFDPDLALEDSECVSQEVVGGSNPSRLFEASDGVYLELDTDVDPLYETEYIAYANEGALFLIDKVNNEARRLTSFSGQICRILPRKTYISEFDQGLNQETWREHDDKVIYAEVVFDTSGFNACDDASLFRRYFQVSLDYDFYADDAELCADEEGGKNTDQNCKTKLLPLVSSATGLAHLVRGYVDDTDTSDLNDKKQVYGYLGWTNETPAKLVFSDASGEVLWTQNRKLEKFDSVVGFGGAYEYGFALEELDDNHYALQLGRDVFLFEGSELFGLNNNTAETLFSDRAYLIDAQGNTLSRMQVVHDDDDFLLFDNAKFFFKDYKSAYVAPSLSRSYVIQQNVQSIVDTYANDYEFSQFEMFDCSTAADETACDLANDVSNPVTAACNDWPSCTLPVDLTDYCVTDAEKTGTTPAEDLCTPSRYQDLNELNTAANDLSIVSFLPYYASYMRGLDFQVYQDQLLMNVRLNEGDTLVLWDYKNPLAVSREKLLFGRRLVQSLSKPVIQDGGVYVSAAVAGARNAPPNADTQICYKGFKEVACNLAKEDEGTNDECTKFDISAGTCRQGRYVFESRALYCSDAQIATDRGVDPDNACDDSNQINSLARQIEDADHDAQWLPALTVDSVNGVRKSMRVLMSRDQQSSTANPSASYVRDEGVLGNPALYQVDDPQTLGHSEGQIQGNVESLPGYLVLRENIGRYQVNAEEFVGGSDQRQVNSYYVNEGLNKSVRVIGEQKSQ